MAQWMRWLQLEHKQSCPAQLLALVRAWVLVQAKR